jgi:tetratricopeptide (TPR) repeat protein
MLATLFRFSVPVRAYAYALLACAAVALACPVAAQQPSPASTGVKAANDTIARGAQQVDKSLQKPIDKANRKIEDATDNIDQKVARTTDKVKAATIKKNTWFTRSYHNLTAYYNVYFNANDSYKEAALKAAKGYPFDYTAVLPMFPFDHEAIPAMVTTELARTLEKCDKTVKKHSITTKPNMKKGRRLTKEEQAFYNRREFCNSIDDAYLLIGKSNVYLHEYSLALMAFDYLAAEYPYEPTVYEGRIWGALVAGATGDAPRERDLLTMLAASKNFPPQYGKLLNEANADLLIREKRYAEAIPLVEQALKNASGSVTKQRYRFILGQLYQRTGDAKKAIARYTSVIRRLPPYEMEFHAKLNRAFMSAGSEGEKMRKTLLKMARDEKNKEYLGMIYYALAEIEVRIRNIPQAVDYYRRSAAGSKSESPQRLLSCFTLAKLLEAQGDYEAAQAYYDSTAMVMPKTDPDYDMVLSRAQNLGKLAANLRIIKAEDSLQRVARMSVAEREQYVKQQIAQAKASEAKRKRDDEIRAARAEAAAISGAAIGQPSSGKWYFYNPQLIGSGLAEFRKVWGQRKLDDDWRRDNKSTTTLALAPDDEEAAAQKQKEQDAAALPPDQTEDYYLANVPLTDSLMEASNQRIVEAMFEAGMVYKDYIRDNPNAIAMFEQLLKRYPGNPHELEAYFYLYVLYSEENKTAEAERYKNRLFTEYPDELLTLYVKDPSYVSDKDGKEKEADQRYGEAYERYQASDYAKALALAQQGFEQYKEMRIAPRFKLLGVMATAGGGGNLGQYMAGLGEVVKEYPETEAAKAAQELLSMVQRRELALISEREAIDTAPAQEQGEPTVPYTADDGESLFVLVVGKNNLNANQLKFNFIAFNADIDADNLSVGSQDLSAELLLLEVGKFKTIDEATAYYKKIVAYPTIFKDMNMEKHFMFSITAANLSLFKSSKIISAYESFFRLNVLTKANP